MKAKVISTVKRARIIILVVWIVAMALGIVPAYFVDHKVSTINFLDCHKETALLCCFCFPLNFAKTTQ